MTYDLNYVKEQVRRAIDAAPTRIDVTRDAWVSDGYGGKKRDTKGSEVLKGATCLFDNATGPDLLSNATDAGRIFAQNGIKIFIMYEDGNTIKPADTVTVIQSGRRYRVVEVHNILEQNIVIELKLEIKD
ncbi:hypothetical protein MS1_48 [Streptococcus virus MS1]|nr:hypothetical protein MS1_48 [Streptococcus virus MS1]